MSRSDLSKPVVAALAVASAGALLAVMGRKRGRTMFSRKTKPKEVPYLFLNDGKAYAVPMNEGDTLAVSIKDPGLTIAFEIEVKQGTGSTNEVVVLESGQTWRGLLVKKQHRVTLFIFTCSRPEFFSNVSTCKGCLGADVG